MKLAVIADRGYLSTYFWESMVFWKIGEVERKRLGGKEKIKVIVKLCVCLFVGPDMKRGNTQHHCMQAIECIQLCLQSVSDSLKWFDNTQIMKSVL